MIGSRKLTLNFSVNWLICIVVIALALIMAFILVEPWRPVFIFTAGVLAGTGALIAAVNALDARTSRFEQTKRAVSLDFLHRWNDPQFFHAKRNGREIILELKEVAKYRRAESLY